VGYNVYYTKSEGISPFLLSAERIVGLGLLATLRQPPRFFLQTHIGGPIQNRLYFNGKWVAVFCLDLSRT
jgi:hypothetical protein